MTTEQKKVQSHFPLQYKSIQIIDQIYLPCCLLRALYFITGLVWEFEDKNSKKANFI